MGWLFIIFGGLLLLLVHAVYFSGRAVRALAEVVPRSRRYLRSGRLAYLLVACSLPVAAVGVALYSWATDAALRLPDETLVDALLVVPFWLVTLWSLQCSVLVIPLDLSFRLLNRLGLLRGSRWRWRRQALVLLILAGFLAFVPTSMALERSQLEVRHHVYASPTLPEALSGMRLVLIADLQADRYTGPTRLSQLVAAVNAQQPDVVVIAGDLITRSSRYIEVAADYVGALQARHGVFACIGDHDNFAYRGDFARSTRQVREALARRGVLMLENEVLHLPRGEAELALVLATNNYISRVQEDTLRALLDDAQQSDLQVLCTHQTSPALLAQARAAGVELVLGGHTHGGQVALWLPFFDLSPVRFETSYVDGSYQLGDMLLVVTSGLGVSMAPLRYRAPASIDVIELERGARQPLDQ